MWWNIAGRGGMRWDKVGWDEMGREQAYRVGGVEYHEGGIKYNV